MAKARALKGLLNTFRKGGRGAKGAAKTGVTAGLASAVTSAFNRGDQAEEDLRQTAGEAGQVIQTAVEKPIKKSAVSSELPQATLAFTQYVKTQAERVEPIRAIGRPLPELTISKKYSPIMKDIIENINGIKKRLERVEIKTRKQTQVLLNLKTASMALNETTKDVIDQDRRNELKEKRKEDEENIERKGIGDTARNVFGKVSNFAGRIKNGLLAAIMPFLTPAALFGTSFAIEQFGDQLPDMDLEEVLNIVDTVEEKVAGLTAAFMGLTSGKSLGRGAQTVGAAMARLKPVAAAVGAVQQVASKIQPGAARFAKFLPALQRIQGFFARISRMTSSITASVARWGSGLGAWFGKLMQRIGRKVLKWYLIFEAFSIMIRAVQLLIMGSIDEAEFHKRTKAQIADIVRILGAPYLMMVLFGFIGTVVGPLGNMAGAPAGFLVGLFLGDKVFEILQMQRLSDGLYDMFFLGDTSTIKSFIPALIRSLTTELPKMMAQAIGEQYERVTRFVGSFMEDRMATEEEIKSKYGEDASDLDILKRATSGLGTDENALLYAFRDIKTTDDYLAFKNKFETEFLPEHNEKRVFGKINSMEEYLQKELLPDEYEQLANQIRTQISENENIENAKLSEFVREVIGVDDRPQITGYGGASQEEFKMWKAGEVVPVTTKDGNRKLMTEEQILTSEEVGIAARESALERLERNKRIAERQGITYTPEQNQEMNVVPSAQNQGNANILIVPPPRQRSGTMNNLAGTEGPVVYTPATPTRQIDDSFIDVAYLT